MVKKIYKELKNIKIKKKKKKKENKKIKNKKSFYIMENQKNNKITSKTKDKIRVESIHRG